jgi:general secretion pathway protein G
MCRIFDNNRGLSLIELVVTMVILSILAGMIVPSARMTSVRLKEIELRRDLREIRSKIDEYKMNYNNAVQPNLPPPDGPKSGYPETLQELVDGHDFGGLTKGKLKLLRRIPMDPFHPVKEGEDRWGLRSTVDEPTSTNWGKEDVFDVYSLSEGTALDGTKYKDW